MQEEIQGTLEKGAISEALPTGRGFVSNIFLVLKKDGSQRPVINLKKLNEYVQTEHFKIEGIHVLKDLLKAGDFMVKIDLRTRTSWYRSTRTDTTSSLYSGAEDTSLTASRSVWHVRRGCSQKS
jgi:hypothetical protein